MNNSIDLLKQNESRDFPILNMAALEEDMDTVEFYGLQAEPTDFDSQNIKISPFQVPNKVGGYVYETTLEFRLCSFICTGSPNHNYRAGNCELTLEDAPFVFQLIQEGSGKRVVELLVHFSTNFRSLKQDPLLFILAICCRSNNKATKNAAYSALPSICRIPTQLFRFLDFCKMISNHQSGSKGWGRAHRKAIGEWYRSYGATERKLKLLALHITKYSKRYGWKHKDVIRLSHLKVNEENPTLKYLVIVAVKGKQFADSTNFIQNLQQQDNYKTSHLKQIVDLLTAIENAKNTEDMSQMRRLILEHKLVREHVPPCFLNDRTVWLALARHMPMIALIRNLGKMSKLKLFNQVTSTEVNKSFEEHLVVEKLKNNSLICKEKIHPFTYMLAIHQYKKGENGLKTLQWPVSPDICTSLEEGLYFSFENIRPTGKRFLVAIDISKSMTEKVNVIGAPSLQAIDVAAFMLTLTIRIEKSCDAIIFSDDETKELRCLPYDRINIVSGKITDLLANPMSGSTSNCSMPFKHAMEKKKIYDVIVIYTDSNISLGYPHPAQALKSYREAINKPDVKLVVCNLACSDVSIGDIEDPFTLTVCGFDSYVPQTISNFINGDY
ncbi:RNA-binding protein RO60-like [Ostrea edulis]|uniref:RNA-binding protein RO60-like n=1 Tax=Ostrea edulis TaxID=37623 RepID=UPI0024AEDDD3|nr:RNA-binding protein RO60-like [Ostrea edulis]